MDARRILQSGKDNSRTEDLGATPCHHPYFAAETGAQIESWTVVVVDLGATLGHRRWCGPAVGAQIVKGRVEKTLRRLPLAG